MISSEEPLVELQGATLERPSHVGTLAYFNVVIVIRSAESGSDWTVNELIASTSPSKFFPTPDPSLDLVDPAIIDSPAGAADPAISDVVTKYLGYRRQSHPREFH